MRKIRKTVGNKIIGYKYWNTRLNEFQLEDGDYGIQFARLSDDTEPRTRHEVIRGKVVVTTFRITPEAAVSLADGLTEFLRKEGIL